MTTSWKYTDDTNKVAVRTLDDGRQESCLASALPEGTQVLAQSEAEIKAAQVAEMKAQLDAMEREAIMPRGAREKELLTAPLLALLLSTLTNEQKAALALIEAQLYAGNPYYKGVKDTDVVATALRAQIRELT